MSFSLSLADIKCIELSIGFLPDTNLQAFISGFDLALGALVLAKGALSAKVVQIEALMLPLTIRQQAAQRIIDTAKDQLNILGTGLGNTCPIVSDVTQSAVKSANRAIEIVQNTINLLNMRRSVKLETLVQIDTIDFAIDKMKAVRSQIMTVLAARTAVVISATLPDQANAALFTSLPQFDRIPS